MAEPSVEPLVTKVAGELEPHEIVVRLSDLTNRATLPAVLRHPRGSISMERALNNLKALLEDLKPQTELQDVAMDSSIDDIESMLDMIVR